MKKLGIALGLVASLGTTAVQAESADKVALDTDSQKVGYSFGQMFGQRLRDSLQDIELEAFLAGVRDAYKGEASRITQEEMARVMQAYQIEQQARQRAEFEKLAAENKARSEAFLAENAKKEGVLTTASGLQYKVIQKGEGPSPTPNDTVVVHYTGTLTTGEQFDSSVARGQPATFPVGGVIPGWVEGLQLMNKGAKFQFFIPSDLAYGPNGNGRIGPNEALVFDVELIDIKAAGQ
ncbi:MAG: FKBP-type peptidyl-prolyl cis-trans isomerase [Gammaproteobacteria bacterium]|nr:MAG: FKBP-type peptidyl-prolyl cis-trans isomerase [Gammaproteobacteria bacterium]